ncbi:gluconate 2-dehydrogenase subunit 3 family protein [Xylanibacillus composti]|uniref:Gluconate 2-dehydrogenase subunit 3 family protein n=1 Tax=Xylanibacillus composti TaxID=1572762 RepID=A0A8J4H0D1_9BACL|nr:gluconate 2-dehydrogenase subunit 3 family protein [Xylanibacillus composti]MDT9723415.1 gluconate 2-dehydrogenase subunit 3 family protein [Xylanibacillus composti]GIQ68549.1 hypothetical protein XYCOK13_13730 [Xylanibacillus composti]
MASQSHYPFYNVMDEQEAWDPHTRGIVRGRLEETASMQFLEVDEQHLLRSVCRVLLDETRSEIIAFVVAHMDQALASPIGESQRKAGLFPRKRLIREGLKRIRLSSLFHDFAAMDTQELTVLQQLLSQLNEGRAEPVEVWESFDQQAFFHTALSMAADGYYSHPDIWSEIGYGGPAYPRGYVRANLGQTDPWEPKAH